MSYEQALMIARKSIELLEEKEGSLTQGELLIHLSALSLSTETIFKRNGITFPSS